MQWIRIGSRLLVFTLLTACNSQSSSDKLNKEVDTVKSWAATVHMVGDAWLRGSVPEAYAKQTLSKAQEELQDPTKSITKAAPSQERSQILDQLKQLNYTIAQMSKAVEHEDRAALTQQIQQLSTQEQTISKLAHTASKQS